MKNSWMKRALAVLLCLAVFAVSELSGVTNVVRDLYAEEMDDGTEASEDADSHDKADDNGGPAEAVEEVALEPSAEDTPQSDEQPQGDPGAEATEGETTTGGEARTEPGGEAVNPDGTEAAEGETKDGDQKEDGAPAEAGTEGTETPAGTEAPATEQEKVFEGQLAEVKEGGSEITAAAVKPEEKPEPILKLVNDEDDNITVTVEAEEAGIIPDGASLLVTPIEKKEVTDNMEDEEKAKTEEINAQYDLTAEKLQEASEQREDDIVGFLAYDICLTDQGGNRTSPGGEVKVTLAYKEAAIPEELKNTETKDADVTVMHLEEDEDGEVKKAVDLADKVEDIKTTGSQEVEETEFVTDSSDIYAIAWTGEVGVYTYENDEVVITVSEETEGAIPAGSRLSVKPIVASEETKEQYQEVAQKLQEKAENEDYEIAGFLAYDITLIDKDGNKIEPNGGVKVAMDYKKAAIPEDLKNVTSVSNSPDDKNDTDNTEQAESVESSSKKEDDEKSENSTSQSGATTGNITVMHLEENDQGQVTKVVDMGAEGKVTELNRTKDQKVTSTEFVTDSFSTFTIVWTSGEETKTITIKFYNKENTAQELDLYPLEAVTGKWGTVELQIGDIFDISDIQKGGTRGEYYQLQDGDGNLYTFVEAGAYYNGTPFGALQTFELTNEGLKFTTSVGDFQEYMLGSSTFSFYYRLGGNEELETVETIDNEQYGITMRMIDYSEAFQNGLLGDNGKWTGGDLTQKIVKKKLEDGYPVLQDGKSLEPLFGETSRGNDVISRSANHLFRKDIYEESGYFSYSSFENYAYFNGKDFEVYTGIGTPGEYDSNVKPGQEVLFYKRGNFLPYNEIEAGRYSEKYYNLYDKDGKQLSPGDDRYNERLYSPTKTVNYSFGMYIEAVFAQPAGGQVEDTAGNKSDMIYEFNGDDDLWVFIDDVLVLDIGGSHDARSGYINFATGTVHIEQEDIKDTNIKDIFKDVKVFPDKSVWNDEKVNSYFKGNTFADFSTHRIKMFYMEHGGAASNLNVKMNLPTIPKGTVEVEKQLGNTDKEKYKDAEFAFQLFAQDIDKPGDDKNKETYKDTYVTLAGALDKATGDAIEFKTETINGTEYKDVFYLKPGQVAQFKNLQSDRKYYVKELDVKSSLYDKVTITGSTVENHDNKGGTTISNDIESLEKTVGERPRVVYINECSAQNSRKLRITKQMTSGQSSEDTFTFKVTFGEKPFDGQYTLIKSKETSPEKHQASAQGEIFDVAVGDIVEIDQIMSDTIFKVEEVNPETEMYTLVGITGKSGSYTEIDNTESDSKALNGKILLGQDAEVTVTNALKNVQTSGLSITKKLKEGLPTTDALFEFKVYQKVQDDFKPYEGNYSVGSETKTVADGKISIKANETAVIEMAAGTQFKVEETLSEGYGTPKITVTEGTATAPVINGNTVTGAVLERQYADITITNVPAYSYDWQIVKKGTTKDSKPLEGAEFTLTELSQEAKVYYGKSVKESGVIQWFKDDSYKEAVNTSDITPGKYELEETKAPAGYRLSDTRWKITLEYKEIKVDKAPNTVIPGEDGKKDTYEYIFLNEAVYELPSTGGIGTYWYTIGGTLLMMAGMLILYRNKKDMRGGAEGIRRW